MTNAIENSLHYDRERLLKRARVYLGAGNKKDTVELDESIIKAADELMSLGSFRFCHEEYSLVKRDCEDGFFVMKEPDIILTSKDLTRYFEGCTGISAAGCTLGVESEKLIKKLQVTDLGFSTIVDATAGALLEDLMDEAEKLFLTGPRTFRFAPGYGDLPLSLNIEIAGAINMTKRIGVSISSSGLFIPQKSMLGIIGLGNDRTRRDCGLCTNTRNCGLRKEGLRCWI